MSMHRRRSGIGSLPCWEGHGNIGLIWLCLGLLLLMGPFGFMGPAAAADVTQKPLEVPASARQCDLVDPPPPMASAMPERLIIGYRADAAPFSYRNADDDVLGYSVGLCTAVAAALVGEENIGFAEVTASGRFTALAAGKVDLLCDSSTLTLRRAACFDHTLLTFPSGPALATRPGAKITTSTAKVGVLAPPSSTAAIAESPGTLQDIATALGVADVTLVPKTSYAALFDGLRPRAAAASADSGEAGKTPAAELDAVFADREILLERARGDQPLVVSEGYIGYEPYTIYLRPNRVLRQQANAVLTEVFKSPRIHVLLNEHFPRLSESVGQLIKLQRIPAH
jgi:ABC-type amino acid transport substrate-binding protein